MFSTVGIVIRLLLAATWITAGSSKVRNLASFQSAVEDFKLLPAPLVRFTAVTIPFIELGVGGALLAGGGTKLALAVSAVFLIVFTIAIIANLARGRQIRCNCFGQSDRQAISWLTVARNILLTSLTAGVFFLPPTSLSLDAWREGQDFWLSAGRFTEGIPAVLLLFCGMTLWFFTVEAVQIARLILKADGGPAVNMPERQWLSRYLISNSNVSAPDKSI